MKLEHVREETKPDVYYLPSVCLPPPPPPHLPQGHTMGTSVISYDSLKVVSRCLGLVLWESRYDCHLNSPGLLASLLCSWLEV